MPGSACLFPAHAPASRRTLGSEAMDIVAALFVENIDLRNFSRAGRPGST